MNLLNILTVIFPFIGIAFWVMTLNSYVKDARRQLGEDIVEIRLYRRWSYILNQVLVVLAVAGPVAIAVFGIMSNVDKGELAIEIARSFLFASVAFTMRKAALLMIGTRGLAFGPQQIVTWDRVEGIAWDRDIGQRLWGVALTVRDKSYKKKPVKFRLYVRRELKENVENTLERFYAAARADELPARNVAGEKIPVAVPD